MRQAMQDDTGRQFYIGIDDTDNLESRGTGRIVRSLAEQMEANNLGAIHGITRHQLLVHPDIPYTSHNSSACVFLTSPSDVATLSRFAGGYLESQSASGSDPGLCVAEMQRVTPEAVRFGFDAKTRVICMEEAYAVASAAGLHLSGHGGSNQGIIGALAGVGLRHSGRDGRFLWLPAIREMSGAWSAKDVLEKSGVRRFLAVDSQRLPNPEDSIELGDWVRPVLLDNEPTLLVQLNDDKGTGRSRWCAVEKDVVKQY